MLPGIARKPEIRGELDRRERGRRLGVLTQQPHLAGSCRGLTLVGGQPGQHPAPRFGQRRDLVPQLGELTRKMDLSSP